MKCAATLVWLQGKTGMEKKWNNSASSQNESTVCLSASLGQNQASVCETGQSSTGADESILRNIWKMKPKPDTCKSVLHHLVPKYFSAVKTKIPIIPWWKFPGSYQKVLGNIEEGMFFFT